MRDEYEREKTVLDLWYGSGSLLCVCLEVAKSIIGITIDSVLCGYIILRILHLFYRSETGRLHRCLRVLLYLLNVLFVYYIFAHGIADVLDQIASLKEKNTGAGNELWVTIVFYIVRSLAELLPYALNMITVFLTIRLLYALEENRYSEESVEKAKLLSGWCLKSLTAVIVTDISINVLQFLLARKLIDMNSSLIFPVGSIVFVLGVLIFARMAAENRQLKEDNDLFI